MPTSNLIVLNLQIAGMSSGSLSWTGNHSHTVNGTVPSGQYHGNFRIDYCCMTGGSASQPISLPTHSPFYLFPYTQQCQEVQGMNVSQEWFKWDLPDNRHSDGKAKGSHPYISFDSSKNSIVHHCFYTNM